MFLFFALKKKNPTSLPGTVCLALFLGYPLPAAHCSQEPEPNGLRSPFSLNSPGIRPTFSACLILNPLAFPPFPPPAVLHITSYSLSSVFKVFGCFDYSNDSARDNVQHASILRAPTFEKIYVTFLHATDSICRVNVLLRSLPSSAHKYASFLMTGKIVNCQISRICAFLRPKINQSIE